MTSQAPTSATISGPPLGQVLVEAKLISEEQLRHVEAQRDAGDGSIGSLLVENGWVSPESLAMALSLHLNLPIISLKRHVVQSDVLKHIPEEIARKHHLIPLDIIEGELAVVMEDPTDLQVVEELTARSGIRIMPMVGVRQDIDTALDVYYKASGRIERELIEFALEKERPEEREGPRRIELTAEDPVVRAVDMMLEQAVRDHASDIHIEPARDEVIVRYRVDGIMRQVLSLPKGIHQPILSRIKVLAGMNIAESRRAQDGQFSIMFDEDEIFFRVASSDTTWGEIAVLRVLGRSETILDLEGLGFPHETMKSFHKMIQAPFGMLLVAGPTGSGKTTTLYAAVNQLDRFRLNIMTIEDPVEYDFSGIYQIQVNRAADITFASGLRAIMRLDPDIILVGEVRDTVTAETATQAALTGHLVLSSIHANDAPSSLFRLAHLGVERYLVSSAVLGVVAQRLVRCICPHCKTLVQPTNEERVAYRTEMGEDLTQYYAGEGCNFCNQAGYLGRTGVFEVLILGESTQQLLLQGASASEIRDDAERNGMIPMRRDGMLKVKLGITTPSEVISKVYSME
jgi:type II secretory ATPase GspE/PulE/Tfp pilus assembly ATPase PilB-like protein